MKTKALMSFVPRFLFLILFVGTGALLLSCASLSRTTTDRATSENKPEMRDVPFAARAAYDASPRKRLMTLPFIDQGGLRSEQTMNVVRDSFIRTLMRGDNVVMVNPQDFSKNISTFFRNGEYDLEGMAKVGAAMGLMAIVEGKVIDIKARRLGDDVGLMKRVRARVEVVVQIRAVATKNGNIIVNEMRQAEVEDTTTVFAERGGGSLQDDPKLIESAVNKAFQGAVYKITQANDKLQWEGRIAMIKGDRVFLNAGRVSGLQVGDILKVSEEGEDVYDPESGALIGKVPGRLKGTLEVINYFGRDGAVGIVHSGSGFKDNDIVELY